MGKQWSKREAQILAVVGSTVGRVGDLQGIAGKAMPDNSQSRHAVARDITHRRAAHIHPIRSETLVPWGVEEAQRLDLLGILTAAGGQCFHTRSGTPGCHPAATASDAPRRPRRPERWPASREPPEPGQPVQRIHPDPAAASADGQAKLSRTLEPRPLHPQASTECPLNERFCDVYRSLPLRQMALKTL